MTQRRFWHTLLNACFPARCVSCGQQARRGAWCHACHAALPRVENGCKRCASPLLSPANALCGACLHRPPPFEATLAACRYTFPLDRLLQDFKYGRRLALAAPLAQLLTDAFRQASVSCSDSAHAVFRKPPTHVVAMPLSATR
ncbi:MAG: double zinc ribbon domain-containing protein, partial [Burkholderiales bacterium]|nr:double zinc ribbon domain-containing protein [Burkholderiales bacterium]